MSLQAPLFPTEAEKKGASAAEVSMQITANNCWEQNHTLFITSSIYPEVLHHFTHFLFSKEIEFAPNFVLQ